MQSPGTILWILLLAVEVCALMSVQVDPYCKRNIRNSLRCSNWNSTDELNQHILELAFENKLGLDDFKQLTVAESSDFEPNELKVAPYLEQLTLTLTNLASSFAGFGKLYSLEYLVVHKSNLDVSESTFLGLNKLTSLSLLGDAVKGLPENWQSSLTSLTSLSMPDNYIKTLEYKSFKGLYNLAVLNMSFNNITRISSDAFRDLPHLTHLFMVVNKIGMLPNGLFDGLHKLVALDLSDNLIGSLEPEIFKDLESLKTLHLNENLVTVLQQTHFLGLNNLETLELNHNNITTLSADLFRLLPEIRTINLNFNKIEDIQAGVFAGLTRLKTLNLSHNNLTRFPIEAFDDNSVLANLNLSDNRLQGLDNINCKSVDQFANTPSPKTCDHSKKLAEITTLNLSNNGITDLALDDLELFPKLKYIRLAGNSLDSGVLEKIYEKYEPIYAI